MQDHNGVKRAITRPTATDSQDSKYIADEEREQKHIDKTSIKKQAGKQN